MAKLQQILEQIYKLDPVDLEELTFALYARGMSPLFFERWRDNQLSSHPSIVSAPEVCGGAATFIRTRIPLWIVARMQQLGASEAEILQSYPSLRAVDLVQAWSYIDEHRDEIEQTIRENEAE